MRPIARLGQPGPFASVEDKIDWLMKMVTEISDASQREDNAIADPFTIMKPVTPLRTLDASAATLDQVRAAFTTFLIDMKKRGLNRASG